MLVALLARVTRDALGDGLTGVQRGFREAQQNGSKYDQGWHLS
jgi:hypothetical protein